MCLWAWLHARCCPTYVLPFLAHVAHAAVPWCSNGYGPPVCRWENQHAEVKKSLPKVMHLVCDNLKSAVSLLPESLFLPNDAQPPSVLAAPPNSSYSGGFMPWIFTVVTSCFPLSSTVPGSLLPSPLEFLKRPEPLGMEKVGLRSRLREAVFFCDPLFFPLFLFLPKPGHRSQNFLSPKIDHRN